jgi:hypothetical protein
MRRKSAAAIASHAIFTTAGQTEGAAKACGVTAIRAGIAIAIVPCGGWNFHGTANFTSARKTIA